MTKITELADEVRILELEVQKLELENRITQLKSELTIDEECIGCAGPCMVVDVAAGLQKELDACRLVIKNFKAIETKETDRLHKIIGEYKETIRLERIDRAADRTVINRKYNEDRRKKNAIIDEKDKMLEKQEREISGLLCLRDMYDGLKAEINELKSLLAAEHTIVDKITRLRVNEVETLYALKAELSARKVDSAVLMEVVEIIRDDTIPNSKVPCMICNLVDAYLDAPDGTATASSIPDNVIDERPEITVTVAFLELP